MLNIKSVTILFTLGTSVATASWLDTLEDCGGHVDHGIAVSNDFTPAYVVQHQNVWAKVLEDCGGHIDYGLAVDHEVASTKLSETMEGK